MAIAVLLVCCLSEAMIVAPWPDRPNLGELIREPVPAAPLTADRRAEQAAAIREAKALARYMNRIWSAWAVDRANLNFLLGAMTVLEQFDTALWTLNPNPTIGEALARVRAYRAWLGVVQQGIKRAKENGLKVDQTERYLTRVLRILGSRYGPLFARAV